jgi:hypothetical protein
MRYCFLILSLLVCSCAPIEHAQLLVQPVDQPLMAGPGDVVARVNKQRNLENLFGNADIYGRKTNEGYAELRYAGLEKDGTIVLFRKDVSIVTNETTMSRSPFSSTFGGANTTTTGTMSGSSFGNTFNASGSSNSNTTGAAVSVNPVSEFHVVIPADTIGIRLPKGETQFPFEGKIVTIMSVSASQLTYRLSEPKS